MTVAVNGERRTVPEGTSVAALLRELGLAERGGIAVALNERVVRRSAHDEQTLVEGDAVEIIRAVSGG